MDEQLDQLKQFCQLPEDTRTLLLQLANFSPEEKSNAPNVPTPKIIAAPIIILLGVCQALKVRAADLRGPHVKTAITHARFIACYLLRSNGYKVANIGQLFNRNHTSVCYAVDMHMELIGGHKPYQEMYQKVANRLNQYYVLEAQAQ